MPVTVECAWCGKAKSVPPSASKRRNYCCVECRERGKLEQRLKSGKSVMCACSFCGAEFARGTSHARRVKNSFCSKRCAGRGAKRIVGLRSYPAVAQRECEQCGSKYRPRHNNSKQKYCTYQCSVLGRTKRVKAECDTCGGAVVRKRFEFEKYDKHYCSMECYGVGVSKYYSGPNHPAWKGGEAVVGCDECGRQFNRKVGHCKGKSSLFCSKECHVEWQRKHTLKGNKNPNWRGDKIKKIDARYEWERRGGAKEFKAAVRARDDYTCQLCGRKFSKYSRGLHVHHKASFAEYPELRSVEANGICACAECHWGVLHSNEGEPLRREMEAEALWELGHLIDGRGDEFAEQEAAG